jgi:hypothetical protein
MMSEEFEQLDELSKSTLGSYVKKASSNIPNVDRRAEKSRNDSIDASKINRPELEKLHKDDWKYLKNKVNNRISGIAKATDKLTKEEVEENIVEGSGPYMLYDPKHPHFASNYNKFKRANPTKGLSHFVDAMKKKEHGDKLKEEVEELDESDSFDHHKDNARNRKKEGDIVGHHLELHNYYKKHAEEGEYNSRWAGGAGSHRRNLSKAKQHLSAARDAVKTQPNKTTHRDANHLLGESYNRTKGLKQAIDKLAKG